MNSKTTNSKEWPEYEFMENDTHIGIITWLNDKRITHKIEKGPAYSRAKIETEIQEFINSLNTVSTTTNDATTDQASE